MEKKVRNFNIDYALNWTYGVPIAKIKEDLDAIEKLGVTHIEIEPIEEFGVIDVSITPISRHLETDEEFAERLAKTEKIEAQSKLRALQTIKDLQEKYKI
jgi:hypothetical protein